MTDADGLSPSEAKEKEDEIAAHDALVARRGEATEPELREEVATALVLEGIALADLARHEEALAVFDAVAVRFGAATEPGIQEQVARALVNRGLSLDLRNLGRHDEAVDTFDELDRRFAASTEPALREQVARALLSKAFDLGRLNRCEQEIDVYDELVGRFGAELELVIRDDVATALFNKAVTLREIGRNAEAIATYDDLVARFGDATEPELREQVARALFGKSVALDKLKRHEEAVSVCDELVARFRGATESGVRVQLARALLNKGFALGELDRSEAEIATYDDLIARFGEATEPELREQVANALRNKGITLGGLGRNDEALAAFDDLIRRFGDAVDVDLRVEVAWAFMHKGITLDRIGREAEAVVVLDDMLEMVGDSSEAALSEVIVRGLITKGITLGGLKRLEEAVIVFDGVISRYLELGPRFGVVPGSETRARVVAALFTKVSLLCELGRSEEADGAPDQLTGILGDVIEPGSDDEVGPGGATRESETNLAALLAETHGGDCWSLFGPGPEDARARELMAERALDLYARTTPFIESLDDEEEPSPLGAIALRQVADGFALLSANWSSKDREKAPMPTRPLFEWVIRLFAIDEWAAERGHPLELRESMDEVEALLEERRSQDEHTDAEFAPAFVAAVRHYELLVALCDSESGRSTLQTETLRDTACSHLWSARNWAGWTWQYADDAAPAGAAMLFIAQGFFVASRTELPSSASLFPSRKLMHDLLRRSDAYDWLANEGAELPDWLVEGLSDPD